MAGLTVQHPHPPSPRTPTSTCKRSTVYGKAIVNRDEGAGCLQHPHQEAGGHDSHTYPQRAPYTNIHFPKCNITYRINISILTYKGACCGFSFMTLDSKTEGQKRSREGGHQYHSNKRKITFSLKGQRTIRPTVSQVFKALQQQNHQ